MWLLQLVTCFSVLTFESPTCDRPCLLFPGTPPSLQSLGPCQVQGRVTNYPARAEKVAWSRPELPQRVSVTAALLASRWAPPRSHFSPAVHLLSKEPICSHPDSRSAWNHDYSPTQSQGPPGSFILLSLLTSCDSLSCNTAFFPFLLEFVILAFVMELLCH